MVPVDGIDESIVVTVYDNNSSDFLIPCKPTDSRAVVSLRMFDTQNDSYIKMPNIWMTFDPTIGFRVNKIKTQNYNNYECKVQLEDREQYSFVTILSE